ncbi:proline dehydrogenase family protein [Rufibacter sediminis]|uniref:Proline dehydrogenase family protein n=1 Tax=Rufibacter sediminis TaxID=2762756 RepID=A0ABR6VXJ4_9BACT|nr:proline dehydrogenase family protein [Rufibacter sediminis]MBC3541371.1 proline dehydrogenase family protein [Rufibacter sediminis]
MNPAPTISFENTAIAFADKSDAELYKTYLLFAAMNNNSMVKMGGGMMKKALSWNLPVKFLIKKSIFEQFCGGETIQECKPTIERLGRSGIGTILDYSVEGESNEASFDHTVQEIISTIDMAANSNHIPFSVFKVTGVADSDLLTKAQTTQELTQAEKAAFGRARTRVKTICQRAFEQGVRVFIDAEESWMQETIDQLCLEMMELYNQERPIVYNTYQLYRHDRLDVIKRDYERAKKLGFYLGGKLVRGAYMEKEGRVAQQRGINNPINPTKQATDALYDEALRFCVEHIDRIAICAGTHNEQSSYHLMQLMDEFNIQPSDERIYFAQLLGMSDNLSYNLAHAGYNVAKYVPYGPVEAVMPYLLRRADENTAIAGQSSREFSLVKKELERRKRKS